MSVIGKAKAILISILWFVYEWIRGSTFDTNTQYDLNFKDYKISLFSKKWHLMHFLTVFVLFHFPAPV